MWIKIHLSTAFGRHKTTCFPEQPDTPFPEQADSFLLFRTHILIQQTYPFPECDNRTEKRETPRCLATTRRPARTKASFSRLKNNALVLLTQQDGFVNTFSDADGALFLALRREMPTFVGTGGKWRRTEKNRGTSFQLPQFLPTFTLSKDSERWEENKYRNLFQIFLSRTASCLIQELIRTTTIWKTEV